jgi:hypothetical protein
VLRYTQYYHIVAADRLRAPGPGFRLEEAMLRAQSGVVKNCDTDEGGCGAAVLTRHMLDSAALPPVFALVIGWESRRCAPSQVQATLAALQPTLRPARAFHGAGGSGGEEYALRSVVCFYGSHYAAFVRPDGCEGGPGGGGWRLFNDASVSAVGDWAAVLAHCARDCLQPSVLMYERTG